MTTRDVAARDYMTRHNALVVEVIDAERTGEDPRRAKYAACMAFRLYPVGKEAGPLS